MTWTSGSFCQQKVETKKTYYFLRKKNVDKFSVLLKLFLNYIFALKIRP